MMIPVDHPRYEGFELEETDSIKTGDLRRTAEKLERSSVQAPYTVYRIVLYGDRSRQNAPVEKGELLTCPRAQRAEVFLNGHSEGVDCSSPEEAVQRVLRGEGDGEPGT